VLGQVDIVSGVALLLAAAGALPTDFSWLALVGIAFCLLGLVLLFVGERIPM
jgi:hypothetical protein